MKKILIIVTCAITSIFAAFGTDIYKLFIKERIFKNDIVLKNLSEDKKKEIDSFISKEKIKDGLVAEEKNEQIEVAARENYKQSDVDEVLAAIAKTDVDFYQRVSYKYSLISEGFIKNQEEIKIKKLTPLKKAEKNQLNFNAFQDVSLKLKDFRRKYQNCTRDAKILNKHSTSGAALQVDENKDKEIIERYKTKKTELDCKKLVLLELDRFNAR